MRNAKLLRGIFFTYIKKSNLNNPNIFWNEVTKQPIQSDRDTIGNLSELTARYHYASIEKMICLVLSLAECDVKDKGKIVYIKTDKGQVMNKLTAMGVIPGLTIQLLKKTPSYLFQMGESQFAIDRGLAEEIQVRLSL